MQPADYYTEKERNKDCWNCNRNLDHTLRDNRLSYYSKTVFIAQTLKLITSFKITKAPLYNSIICLMNVTKEMHHVFINNMSKI